MLLNHQQSLNLLAELKSISPVKGNLPLKKGQKYPKSFKQQVLKALRQGISVSEISEATRLKGFTIRQWKEADSLGTKSVRKLQVVHERSVDTSTQKKNLLTIKIGRSSSIEINQSELTKEFLMLLAEV